MSARDMHDDHARWHIAGDRCFYCGELATTDEHWPPKSLTWYGFILPACHECNNLAGTEHPTNLEARINYVKAQLRRHHAPELAAPEWFPDEMEELGYNLQVVVKRGVELKEEIERRLGWSPILYLLDMDESRLSSMFSKLRDCPHGPGAACIFWDRVRPQFLPAFRLPALERDDDTRSKISWRALPTQSPPYVPATPAPYHHRKWRNETSLQQRKERREKKWAADADKRAARAAAEVVRQQHRETKLEAERLRNHQRAQAERQHYRADMAQAAKLRIASRHAQDDRTREFRAATYAEAAAHGAYGPRDMQDARLHQTA